MDRVGTRPLDARAHSAKKIRQIDNLWLDRGILDGGCAVGKASADEQVLCRNVTSLNLSYFDGEGWVDEWDSTADANSLPLAVQIDIKIANNAITAASVPQERRLVQSFAIPCGIWAKQEDESTESEQGGS